MTFINIVDKDRKDHWINPKNVEQISDDPYYDGSKIYFTSGRCIELADGSDKVVDMILGRMEKE